MLTERDRRFLADALRLLRESPQDPSSDEVTREDIRRVLTEPLTRLTLPRMPERDVERLSKGEELAAE